VHGLARRARPEVERHLLGLMSGQRPGDVAQALMDLGAAVCRPRRPRCVSCPLSGDCAAFAMGEPERFPAPRKRKPRPNRFGTAWWVERDGCVWLVRRPAKGLLGGMAALPGSEWTDSPAAERPLGTVRHVFTHFSLELAVELRPNVSGEGWWHPVDRLDSAGLPTLYRRASEIALAACRDSRAAA